MFRITDYSFSLVLYVFLVIILILGISLAQNLFPPIYTFIKQYELNNNITGDE